MQSMRRISKHQLVWMAGAATLALTAGPASAQSVNDLEEVIVTARKREERLQDIPAAGSAISRERIDDSGGIQDPRSLVAFLPGVSLVDNDSTNSEFAIRGAGQAGRSINADAAIALLRNGAQVTGGNIGGRGFARMDYFDLERIEVLRGAQGSLYGTNAVGGIVSIVSREPATTFGGLIQAGYNFDKEGYDLLGVVNMPVNEKFALRAGVDLTEQVKGEVFNTFLNKYIDRVSYRGARVSAAFRPSQTWKAVLSLDVSRLDEPTGGQVDVQRRRYDAIVETWDYLTSVEGNTEANLRQNIFNGGLVVNGELGTVNVTSVTNYRWRDSTSVTDDDGRYPGAPPLVSTGQLNIAGGATCRNGNCSTVYADQVKAFYQELRFNGELGALAWQAGGDLRKIVDDYSISNFGRRSGNTPVAPQYQLLLSDNRTVGAFASVSYHIAPTIIGEASSRWTWDRKEFEGGLNSGGFKLGSIPHRSKEFVNWTYGLSLSWRPDDDTNAYARFATGFRAGGFNRDTGRSDEVPGGPQTPQAYNEEGTKAYEVGLKRRFSRAVNLSASAFYSQYKDVLVVGQGTRSAAQGGGTFNYLDNFGDAWARGIDIEVSGAANLTARSRLNYNIAGVWVKSKLDSQIATVDGRQLNGTPAFGLTANGTYAYRLRERLTAFLNATYQRERGGWRNLANTTPRDNVYNLQLRGGFRSPDGWEVALRATNLLNDRYRLLTGAGFYAERPDRQITLQARQTF